MADETEMPPGLPASPVRPAPATMDASIMQGNRVVTQAQINPTNPVKVLEDKIRDHFSSGMNLLADLRAAADTLEALLNQLKTGTAS